MQKVSLVLGIKANGQVDVLERANLSYTRTMLIEAHANEGKHDYYTVIDAWTLKDEIEEPEPKDHETHDSSEAVDGEGSAEGAGGEPQAAAG